MRLRRLLGLVALVSVQVLPYGSEWAFRSCTTDLHCETVAAEVRIDLFEQATYLVGELTGTPTWVHESL